MADPFVRIVLDDEERAAARPSPATLARAAQALREDGLVVLEDVVSAASISALRERCLADVDALLARPDAPYNWTKGNIQQDPPPFPPYLCRDVLVNDVVIAVTRAVLGAGLCCDFYSGNTALTGDRRQPVHADTGQLWPGQTVPHPAFGLVVNLPLVDMGPENGSTEVWPGSHVDPTVSVLDGELTIPEAALEARRAASPPLQPVVRAGSVVVRDIRLWHAGMPNRTPDPRPMIAMIHYVSWWPTGAVRFGAGSEPFLAHPDLRWKAEIVEGGVDHIAAVQGYRSEEA